MESRSHPSRAQRRSRRLRAERTEAAPALVVWLRGHSISVITANIHPGNTASAAIAEHIGLRPTDGRADDETVWRAAY